VKVAPWDVSSLAHVAANDLRMYRPLRVRALVVGMVCIIDTAGRASCRGAGADITAELVVYAARVALRVPG
jgi:hypothetical protein